MVPDPLLKRGHIVAIGGWGLVNDLGRPLPAFLAELTGRERPRACYLGTAGGDRSSGTAAFYEGFSPVAEARHLPLFSRPDEIEAHIREADIVYVGGGNTVNMLAIWRIHGVDLLLREAWERGAVLAGVSAGSLCWFESGVTDSFGPALAHFDGGLGLLPGSNCPHYDGEARRRPVYQALVGSGRLPAGYAADDGSALVFAGTELREVVAWREGARAYRVEPDGAGGVRETALDPARRIDR